jgi:two-component system, sensor histidine kinase
VRSEPGKGSIFNFRARLAPVAAVAEGPPAAPAPRAPQLRRDLHVMIAEDNRTNMMIVRKMLQPQVHLLSEAQNGAEAVALYQARPPDLVLMDVSMPVLDGLQATRDIRTHEAREGLPPCPILALTANAFGEDREACLAAGMDGFLTKPLSRHDLLSAIAAVCPEAPPDRRAIGL